MEDDLALKSRILSDEKQLKRCVLKYNEFLELSPEEKKKQSTKYLYEILLSHHTLRRHEALQKATRQEIQFFKKEIDNIQTSIDNVKLEMAQLKNQLESATIEKNNKMEYDRIALEIQKLPTRQETQKETEQLYLDIDQIKILCQFNEQIFEKRKLKLHELFDFLLNTQKQLLEMKPLDEASSSSASSVDQMDIDNGKEKEETERLTGSPKPS